MKRRMITQKQIRNFEYYMIREEKSPLTIQKYLRDIRHFLSFSHVEMLNKELTISYKNYLERNFATASTNSMLAALNSFFRFLGWNDLCVKQFRVQKPVYCSDKKELSKAEYFLLVQTANRNENEKLSLIMQTLCSSGLRVSELQFITVEAIRKGEVTINCKGKLRTIFILDKMKKKLLKYAKKNHINSGAVFVTKSGKPVNRSNIWREMKKLCKNAGVSPEKVFPHNLRHLFARIFYELEKDIAKLADVLGHSNINTTRFYILTTGTEHKKRMERMQLII